MKIRTLERILLKLIEEGEFRGDSVLLSEKISTIHRRKAPSRKSLGQLLYKLSKLSEQLEVTRMKKFPDRRKSPSFWRIRRKT